MGIFEDQNKDLEPPLTFWRRNYFFLNFSTPVYKM